MTQGMLPFRYNPQFMILMEMDILASIIWIDGLYRQIDKQTDGWTVGHK